MKIEEICRVFDEIADGNIPYLSQWYMDRPAIVTDERYNELKKLQGLLYRAICHFVKHFIEFEPIFCLNEKARRVVEICKAADSSVDKYAYRPGTYRPDILFDIEGGMRICEIGGRFPLNGYLASGFSELIGIRRFIKDGGFLKSRNEYERFLRYLFEYWDFQNINDCNNLNGKTGPKSGIDKVVLPDKVVVLKGADRPCDIKYYIPLFEKLKIEVKLLSPQEFASDPGVIKGVAVINEFNQMEIESFDENTIHTIAESNALNDLRTIFLIHDKRFLAVLCDDGFQRMVFDDSEREFINKFLIPTYTFRQGEEGVRGGASTMAGRPWYYARRDKDNWLLKHSLLGKSEKVYAGCHCSREEWEGLFTSGVVKDMVLQPHIRQRTVSASINDDHYNDYVTGTMLCFDNNFFGPGLFRTSSFDVTNKVDDRKMAICYTNTRPDNNIDNNYDFIL